MKQFLYAALVLALFSCKKKKDEEVINTTTPSKEQLVGTYRKTAEMTNGQDTWNGTTGGYDACELDDTYALNADNSLVVTDAGIVCTPSGGGTGTWSVAGSTLTLEGIPFAIVGFNGSSLTVRSTFPFNGQTYTIDETYTRQ
ncbi:lipocalin family protein [Flaviaesturariibacter aridisoli]|uniref:Lipocalin-like domain-containing protein n=1 Tax=Flaviaesturariibacter aridisoli TaxID=2545761 RepID=A0A4R4E064_9BACT|nr:lipocalin family protein [Flaviaesturariibacter aridisoli]TCZ68576.1 hypothetical protein E0486_13715 [Flaviaesturariibacter aridisoli]